MTKQGVRAGAVKSKRDLRDGCHAGEIKELTKRELTKRDPSHIPFHNGVTMQCDHYQ